MKGAYRSGCPRSTLPRLRPWPPLPPPDRVDLANVPERAGIGRWASQRAPDGVTAPQRGQRGRGGEDAERALHRELAGASAEERVEQWRQRAREPGEHHPFGALDRKSTRLNSSHGYISYAVFCLKKH